MLDQVPELRFRKAVQCKSEHIAAMRKVSVPAELMSGQNKADEEMHLEKVVGLGQVHGLTPPEVLLVDKGSNATELHEVMLFQLGCKRQLIEVVVGGHALTQALQ